MHTFVYPKESQIAEDAITHFALEISLLGGHVVVQVQGEFVPLSKIVAANIADIQTSFVEYFHVLHDRLRFPADGFVAFTEQAGVHIALSRYNLKMIN